MRNRTPTFSRILLSLSTLVLACLGSQAWEPDFDRLFTGRTLRFDYYHSGTSSEERISLDEFRLEGDWSGSRRQLIDTTNLGKYLFEIVDPETNRAVYTRGFASIYGEWETTGEAREGMWRTFHESVRFPEPRSACLVVLKKRDRRGFFSEIFSVPVDPAGRFVNRTPLQNGGEIWSVFQSGPPAEKVDLLILGDGYTESALPKFRGDVRRLTSELFSIEPFRSRRGDFNVWSIDLASQNSGISDPRQGKWRNSALHLSFNAFDTDRYVLSFENKGLRELAARAPYDALVILFNERKYGGGGIFNLWATSTSDSSESAYVFVHEFGHSFGGLGDEYYSSQVAYEEFNRPGVEPWEPNITALLDAGDLKWKDLVTPGIPLPTPWDQDVYDRLSLTYQEQRQRLTDSNAPDEEVEGLFAAVKEATSAQLAGERHYGQVGAFEGASYEAKGLYRPSVDCIMFTRNPRSFCRVCEQALSRVIDLYAAP